MSFFFCARCLFLIACLSVMSCSHRPSSVSVGSANAAADQRAININTASLDELERIPHVGEKVASKIIEYRETHGPFRRIEHLMLIQGISDKRFRKIRPLVRVE